MLAADFSRWLKRKEVLQHKITSGHPIRNLRYRRRRHRLSQGGSAALAHLMAFLRNEKVIRLETTSTPSITSVEGCVQVGVRGALACG